MRTFHNNLKYTRQFIGDYNNGTYCPDDKRIMWGFISCQARYKISEQFILKFKDKLNFSELSTRSNFSLEFLELPELRGHWDILRLAEYSKKTPKFVIGELISFGHRLPDRIRYHVNSTMSLDILEELIESDSFLLDWETISERQDLSKSFVEKHITSFNLEGLLEYSNFKRLYKKDDDLMLVVSSLNELI